MNRTATIISAMAAMAGSAAGADTRYMLCFGGGRAGLYYSGVFPVAFGTKSEDKAKAFNAFVAAQYHRMITSECHMDLTLASASSDKKIREQSDQGSRFPSKLIETGWGGK